MTKAYWVAHVTVDDPVAYEDYRKATAVPFQKYGARFLARGGRVEVVEGETRPRCVVIEFEDMETAKACYNSPEYQAAKALRTACSTGDVMLVEGWDG
ncbi:DUF1330 domain-containing protein [Paracoccus marinus]|uniref:DUF1330 domain-containing protein n=1 Tax=Paracoccus marinus TaxID=288426 RepID=UPI00103DD69D|nr:DUF1330 domain-containing protein [Paracoccus marinus]GLS81525.1 hypothetical protein GCM10007893_23360 [Paracoccus marinus]